MPGRPWLARLVLLLGTIAGLLLGAVAHARRRADRARQAVGPRLARQGAYETAATRVLILGAGFAGLAAARALDRHLGRREDVGIMVVDRANSLLFTPLLWTVADGRTNPNHVSVPLRSFQRGHTFRVQHAEVLGIDLDRREARTSAGPYPYDVLVVALGSTTTMPDLPGLRRHAALFATPADALRARNRLIDAVEAAHHCREPEARRAWLTFVIAGGGNTGVELAMTLHAYLTAGLLAEYPWLRATPARIIVVSRTERLLPTNDRRLAEAARRWLERAGIEVHLDVSVEAVTGETVRTSRGTIAARTLFWAAGVAAPDLVRALPGEHAGNGAVIVDGGLRLPAHPEVFVIGDASWVVDAESGEGVPPTAQAAEYQGRYVAEAILARRAGRQPPPFRFRPRGHLVLLGRRAGLAAVGPLLLTGRPAWLLWHAYYLARVPAWRNRVRLLVDWGLAALTGRETSQLRLEPSGGPRGREEEPA